MLRAMPDLDLGPDDYRKKDAGSNHWYEPDDPRAFLISAGMAVLVLGIVFFNLHEIDLASIENKRMWFAFVVLFGVGLGFFIRALTSRWR